MTDSVTIEWQITGSKIGRYLLDLTSKRGASKAKYLLGFGFDSSEPDILANALVEHAMGNLPGVPTVTTSGFAVVVFEGAVRAPDGWDMPLRTVWEPRVERTMRFVTAVPLTR